MQALASQEKTELTFGEIRAAFQKIHRNYALDRLGFINVGLGDLVGKYHVLQSRGRPKSPNRTYRFANPLMRVYVLLMGQAGRPSCIGSRVDPDFGGLGDHRVPGLLDGVDFLLVGGAEPSG